ncbi:MAG: type II secretion system F family protein [Planctomycetota bacterium]
MSVWKYTAGSPGTARLISGYITAPTEIDARDALRLSGLRPVRVRPVTPQGSRPGRFSHALNAWRRRRRTGAKAEAFDALATLIRSGVTPLRALRVLAGSHARSSPVSLLSRSLAEQVSEGTPFSEAARSCPGWFDPAECAMLSAGERSGELEGALTRLAERQARAEDLGARLAAVMLYPLLVTTLGIGVGTFLSVRTLPQLAAVLTDAGVEVPRLTTIVTAAGRLLTSQWPIVMIALTIGGISLAHLVSSRTLRVPAWCLRRVPRVFRRACTAESFLALAELTESGLTLVESVRVVAPTATGPFASALGETWDRVADRVEQGTAFEQALSHPAWFTDEHRELLAAGARAGELSGVLRRLGERDRRSARRLIDRAASVLEPAAIVLLTGFVGIIVLAAVLPIVKLQEIIG